MTHNIFWFRNNLRLEDNHALNECIKKSQMISFIYIINPHLRTIKNKLTSKDIFIIQGLLNLRTNLNNKGHRLHIFYGEPKEVFNQISELNSFDEIYCEEILAPYEKSEVNLIDKKTNCIWDSTLIEPNDLPCDPIKIPDTFTIFRNMVEKNLVVAEPVYLPGIPEPVSIKGLNEFDLPDVSESKFIGSVDFLNNYSICEFGAKSFVDDYFKDNKASNYKITRNELSGKDFSTKFSVWLSQGFISARQLYKKLKNYESTKGANESTYWIFFELLWRDYFRFLHIKYGENLYFKYGLMNSEINIIDEEMTLEKLEGGKTDSSFMNAAIRELIHSGFLSNRMRQILASYIIFDLKTDWRVGTDFYQKYLIDFDIYSNQGNWLYIAGYGTDPRGGRRFNVIKQKNTYDITNEYEMRWNDNT